MKIKLVEMETISKIEPNLEKYVFPAFEKYNLYFDVNSKLARTSFDAIYRGIYRDGDRSASISLEFVTTHVDVDRAKADGVAADCTMKVILFGKKYNAGAVNTRDAETVINAFNDVLADNKLSLLPEPPKPIEKLIPASDGSGEAHTEEEWKRIYAEKKAALPNDGTHFKNVTNEDVDATWRFYHWVSDVYPFF